MHDNRIHAAASALRPQQRKREPRSKVTFSRSLECINSINATSTTQQSATVSNQPVCFKPGRYAVERSRQRLPQGEEVLWKGHWSDPDNRAHLARRLRRELLKRKAMRDGVHALTADQQADLEKSCDTRLEFYRHLLLIELADGGKLSVPVSE